MGSGGGGGDSYDAAYNARIATLMEEESGRAEEQLAWEKQHLRPYEEAMIAANTELMPYQTANAKALAQNKGALMTPFYNQLQKGLNVDGQVNAAVNDVYSAFDKAESGNRMNAMRMGINPNSNAFTSKTMGLDRAKAAGLARSSTRMGLEQQNLNNMMMGLQL